MVKRQQGTCAWSTQPHPRSEHCMDWRMTDEPRTECYSGGHGEYGECSHCVERDEP